MKVRLRLWRLRFAAQTHSRRLVGWQSLRQRLALCAARRRLRLHRHLASRHRLKLLPHQLRPGRRLLVGDRPYRHSIT